MFNMSKNMRLRWGIALCVGWLLGISISVQAMPAQVPIIRHAEKFEDRHKIHLYPQGQTRARALAQFFQTIRE